MKNTICREKIIGEGKAAGLSKEKYIEMGQKIKSVMQMKLLPKTIYVPH